MQRLRTSLQFHNPVKYRLQSLKPFSNKPVEPHFENVGSMASQLKSRSVLRLRGPDTVKFLQGLLTNDVRKFSDPIGEKTSNLATPNVPIASIPPLYSAILNPQGRFLYDMFVYRPPRADAKLNESGSGPGSDPNGDLELLLDVDGAVVHELLQTLKNEQGSKHDLKLINARHEVGETLKRWNVKYRLRSKVEIENVSDELSCWQRYGQNLAHENSSVGEPEAVSVGWATSVDCSAMSASKGNDVGWQWFKDPRLDCLGFRGIFPSHVIPPLVEADKEADERNYLLWRIEKGVAEGSTEMPKGEAIPLEYNLASLNAISFDKGCYVGQELIARTHHRGVIRKRLLPLKFHDNSGKEIEQKVSPGSEVIDPSSGKKAGIVTTALGCRGLGLLRLDEAFKGSGGLTIGGQEGVKVEAYQPKWWPPEWFQEQQQHGAGA
ncbi:hypothetical protein RJ641_001115 [Dillenia turbinata]|uniref:CAF17 C-terminal domain-containing protein n=1 Tax=Dillenia turbinata TaxID=194707 RepID=A0AAN8ZS44_9MAGN